MTIDWIFVLALAAGLGSALMSGLFFTFSNFIMQALNKLPPPQGIAAMQEINRAVLNWLFLSIFVGSAAVSLLLCASAALSQDVTLAVAGLLYLTGCFGVTAAKNVPLNQRLDALDCHSADAHRFWQEYQRTWLRWNHVRAVATLAATAAFILGLMDR